MTVLSSAHGRGRRLERNIAKRDLQAAIKYGIKEKSTLAGTTTRWMYTFAGIVYLTDKDSKREITSWPEKCFGMDLEKVNITSQMLKQHKKAAKAISNKSRWHSHTVAVVDQSGSMRHDDASEGATRSDVVWLTLALDFVGKRLRSGEASSWDIFSLVGMRSEGDVLIHHRPTDWVLYNELIDLLRNSHPMGDGNYIPSLDRTEDLLLSNPYSSCALLVIFLSDGRPSDRLQRKQFSGGTHVGNLTLLAKRRVGALASRFGRRLTIGSIAFGNTAAAEDFSTLKGIADVAREYGSLSYFHPASLSVDSLAKTFTFLSSTLTSTKTEMTALGSSRQKKIREVVRETVHSLGGSELDESWFHVTHSKKKKNIVRTQWEKDGWHEFPKSVTFLSPHAVGIAVKKAIFGEGAERIVREIREVNSDGEFVGPPMVGKDSRFTEKYANIDDRKRFHQRFCKTQKLAQKIAVAFNKRLDIAPFVDHDITPKIEFLDSSVYIIQFPDVGPSVLLVEKMLNIKRFEYKKWNSNNGYVVGREEGNTKDNSAVIDLCDVGSIAENSVEGNDSSVVDFLSDDDVEEDNSHCIDLEDIPQAFSCFSYYYTKRKALVCDLQGVLDDSVSPPIFRLTDPVVHYQSSSDCRHVYGRTDKGSEGMRKFFRTHNCSNLCKILRKRWYCSSSP